MFSVLQLTCLNTVCTVFCIYVFFPIKNLKNSFHVVRCIFFPFYGHLDFVLYCVKQALRSQKVFLKCSHVFFCIFKVLVFILILDSFEIYFSKE